MRRQAVSVAEKSNPLAGPNKTVGLINLRQLPSASARTSRAAGEKSSASRPKHNEKTMSERKLILVLDDDASILGALKRVLAIHGFAVQVFQTVEDFLAHASLREAACLVLDINVNDASGIDLSYQLKRSECSLPVIFITGADSERTRATAWKAGCTAYLVKPFGTSALVKAIRRAIGHRPQ